MKTAFTEKYKSEIQGKLSCYDRVVIKGTLHSVSHAQAMSNLLYRRNTLLKDFPKFIKPYRDKVKTHAEYLAKTHGIKIEFIRKSGAVRKEDLVSKHMSNRQLSDTYVGLVCILSCMERCQNYVYRYDKSTGRSYLQMTSGKCLHYYYYFIDKDLGLCYLRVPTWCPYRLQFYFNGHNWLARQLTKVGISYEQLDNVFVHISDYQAAQNISNSFDVSHFHRLLDSYAHHYLPIARELCVAGYHWTIMQLEYATDIVFKNPKTLQRLYDELLNKIMPIVQPDDVAKFLGRKYLHGRNNLELDTSCKQITLQIKGKRHHMRRIKHRMGSCSVKMYDKFNRVLRIETTTNNTQEFRHYRSVEQRDGTKTSKVAPVKKSIYSLKPLQQILENCNKRYLNYIGAFDAPNIGKKRLQKVTRKSKVNNRNYRGFNFFDKEDEQILKAISNGAFTINGFRNKQLKTSLKNKSTAQISRILKRLKVKGLIRKIKKSYRYMVTTLGQKIIATALNFKELVCPHQLNY